MSRAETTYLQLRQGNQPDELDAQRVTRFWQGWRAQDAVYRSAHRQIEDNLRMLAGQHWAQWNPLLGRYIDITHSMTDRERRFRHRPTINLLLQWFALCHARMTESQPILTFLPGPDRHDADLAEVLDELFKWTWRKSFAADAMDQIVATLLPCGTVYWQTRVDFNRGPLQPWVGRAEVPVIDAQGTMVNVQEMPDVPFDANGKPLRVLTPDGPMDGVLYDQATGQLAQGQPHHTPSGELVFDVMTPFEVRGQWGPTPWHLKKRHDRVALFTVQEVEEMFGVKVDPDIAQGSAAEFTELHRALLGGGYFGSTGGDLVAPDGMLESGSDEFVTVGTRWEAPCKYPGMERTPSSPGGRLLIVTPTKVLYDGPRPAAFENTSPIRRLDFIRIPGRPLGTTYQEAMNPVVRAYNRGVAQQLMQRDLVSNPIALIDSEAGLPARKWTNEPGQGVRLRMRPGVTPVHWLEPPSLGPDHYRIQSDLRGLIDDLGNLRGTQGEPLSPEQSGEALKELRFNSDRAFGPTARRLVTELGRTALDIQAWGPLLYTREQVLQIAGDDNRPRAIVVYPELWSATVNVFPDAESMLPEGRGERQDRAWRLWEAGAWGPKDSPEARRAFLELARFPHLGRATRPGGVHRVMAEQVVGRILDGEYPQIGVAWDIDIHLSVLDEFVAGPDFGKQPPQVQEIALAYRDELFMALPQWHEEQQYRLDPLGLAGGGGAGGVDENGDPLPESEGVFPAGPEAPESVEQLPTTPLQPVEAE